ncbi:hypothetical protein AAY473_039541 [Plecturocebus cupreus]
MLPRMISNSWAHTILPPRPPAVLGLQKRKGSEDQDLLILVFHCCLAISLEAFRISKECLRDNLRMFQVCRVNSWSNNQSEGEGQKVQVSSLLPQPPKQLGLQMPATTSRVVKLIKTEGITVAVRSWREGNELFNVYRVSVLQDEKVLKTVAQQYGVSLCHPGWSAVAYSQLIATSDSLVQHSRTRPALSPASGRPGTLLSASFFSLLRSCLSSPLELSPEVPPPLPVAPGGVNRVTRFSLGLCSFSSFMAASVTEAARPQRVTPGTNSSRAARVNAPPPTKAPCDKSGPKFHWACQDVARVGPFPVRRFQHLVFTSRPPSSCATLSPHRPDALGAHSLARH